MMQAIATLEALPEPGSPIADRPRHRQILYGSRLNTYRIIYRIMKKSKRVVIVHVRHGARLGSRP